MKAITGKYIRENYKQIIVVNYGSLFNTLRLRSPSAYIKTKHDTIKAVVYFIGQTAIVVESIDCSSELGLKALYLSERFCLPYEKEAEKILDSSSTLWDQEVKLENLRKELIKEVYSL